MVLGLLLGCEAGGPPEDGVPSWEVYLAAATRTFEGQTSYVIDGDIPVSFEELQAEYQRVVDKEIADEAGVAFTVLPSTVNRVNNRDDLWTPTQAMSLTYCITNDFGTNKQRVVNEMAQATADWEAEAAVNFTYVSAQDGSCTGGNTNVTFAVRPWTSGGACAFFPSGGGCVARTLVIDIADLDSNYAPVTTQGVFRHELGHVLGLRHEHVRQSGTSCSEGSWRGVTPYDRSSVMHYPWCPGATNGGDLVITGWDATGVGILYPGACASAAGCSSFQAYEIPTCMGTGMTCQILPQEHLPTASGQIVVVTGGGYSGSWTQLGYRCGTTQTWQNYIEVYVDDADHAWPWPTACVLRGDTYTMSSGHLYSFRGPSFVGATPLPIALAAFGPPANLTATALSSSQVRLSWSDVWTTKDGVKVERAQRALYATPTPVLPIGYNQYPLQSSGRAILDASATRFCQERGYVGFAAYSTYGPVGAAYSWWSGSSWSTTGNNNVTMMSNLDCATAWTQVGIASGGTVTSYTDGSVAASTRYAYRVRGYRGTQHTGYGAAVVVTTLAQPPFSVSVSLSGGYLWATPANGTAPYTYGWYKYLPCTGGPIEPVMTAQGLGSLEGDGPTTQDIPCNTWMGPYTGSPPERYPYASRYRYKVHATDGQGRAADAYYPDID